ncbi:serine/threonine-protein kinase [Chondromyces apiculatus]|uniref:Serine/threonine kinase PKN9 n=1 Tax=Chondromyces apiculatus DSM 436 TaxID=1192034 RepID=A0A017T863_9BACT|nr:serine/threonine-protein kinase [Chondromyces apiculatus]EYF05429.1 Serine/threonine kinase PKN9 [Chondromyces apiculatus DSM 436]
MATAQATASSANAHPRPFNSDELPRRFGRYLLLRRLARGGMGEVFLASTAGFEGAERPVVVKVIRREHAADPSFIARFLDEARVQAQLQHSGVAQVIEADIDEESGEPFVVVEHVEGRSLGDVRTRAAQLGQQIEWPEAVAITALIAEGLTHVHERRDAAGRALGIVHRDLSPQNVMVGFAGDVKIIDFGTARGQNRRCHTVAGVVFAKPGYVAPEVANGDPGDARVDVYALGIMLWELCAGRRFLQGDAQAHLTAVAQNRSSTPPLCEQIGAPAELDGIIARLTTFDREARYASSREAARDLAALLGAAQTLPSGERGVRARAAHFMHALFPGEPARTRREFSDLVTEARASGLGRPRAAEASAAPQTKSDPAAAPPPGQRLGEGRSKARGPEGRTSPAEPGLSEAEGMLPGTRYRLKREVGRGAFSVVHEVEHVDLGRRLALKVIAAEHASSPEVTARFRREARVLSALSHEGLVKVHDFGVTADGRLFCGMDLCEGESLDAHLAREQVMGWREAFALAIPVLSTLERVHAEGVVHRDLKPSNLFLLRAVDAKGVATQPSRVPEAPVAGAAVSPVKLLDFGLATGPEEVAATDVTPLRAGVAIVGTPEYMAPEQASSGRVDGRADVYALGCMLYEMITGRLPFVASSTVALLEAKTRGSPERLRDCAPERQIPAQVDEIVMRALARHPSVRFQSAAEMRRALESVLWKPARGNTLRRAGGIAVAAAALAVAGVIFTGSGKAIADLGGRAAAFLPWRTQSTPQIPTNSLADATRGPGSPAEQGLPVQTASTEVAAGVTPPSAHPLAQDGAGSPEVVAPSAPLQPAVSPDLPAQAAEQALAQDTLQPSQTRPRAASRQERSSRAAPRPSVVQADAGKTQTAQTAQAATEVTEPKVADVRAETKEPAAKPEPKEPPSGKAEARTLAAKAEVKEAPTKADAQRRTELRNREERLKASAMKDDEPRATDAEAADGQEAKRRRKRKSRRAKAD